jgi:hypothetical protein
MSVQLVACAPQSFFKLFSGINPEVEARAFCQTILRETGVALPESSREEGMCEDMINSELGRMNEVIHGTEYPKASALQGGDLCIPTEQTICRKIRFPWSWYGGARDKELYVTSTADFAAAVAAAEPILEEKMDDPSCSKDHLDCFREVIAYANKHRFPIFWSL